MLAEIQGYAELEDAVAAATTGLELRRVLELGTGTGETAVRILAQHPAAEWVGIDASEAMLARARERLPRADLRAARLEDPLPEGPFDLVVSVLAVHHLAGEAKRSLFTRVAQLSHNFVMGDVVVPERPEDAVIEIDGVYDVPSSVADQVAWLEAAGFDSVETRAITADLAVFAARRS
jgi:tRNA (cmo5U34)-methyltransferase